VQTPTAPQQQLKQQHQKQPGVDTPCRRPSYSAGLPLFASTKCSTSSGDALDTCNSSVAATVLSGMISDGALAAGGVVALAVVPSTLASSGSYGGAAGSGGGAVCRLVVLSAGGCVTLYSVMLGGAGSDVAGADLGMRSGECWAGCLSRWASCRGWRGCLIIVPWHGNKTWWEVWWLGLQDTRTSLALTCASLIIAVDSQIFITARNKLKALEYGR
jgi:hypothetical protein